MYNFAYCLQIYVHHALHNDECIKLLAKLAYGFVVYLILVYNKRIVTKLFF